MSTSATRTTTTPAFMAFLDHCEEQSWTSATQRLLPSIHEVDRNATQIWFAFYPLSLYLALSSAEDTETLARELLLQGDYRLEMQIDSSHRFLYGHRYWTQVKQAIERHAQNWNSVPVENSNDATLLAEQVLEVARSAAGAARVDQSIVVGITAVGFMTLRQVGLAAFSNAPGKIQLDSGQVRKKPEQVLKERARDDSQGLLGFLKTVDKRWTVVFDENDNSAKYKLNHLQDLAWGAAEDRSRDWTKIDPRRIEGPIPVECRSASCGTCWVGILGGAAKLSPVAPRESKKIKEFGYIDTDESKPLIRLACQAQAEGAVSIVIPPWNGVFGKYLKQGQFTKADDEADSGPVN